MKSKANTVVECFLPSFVTFGGYPLIDDAASVVVWNVLDKALTGE